MLWFNPTTRDADIWKISNGQWAGSVDIGTHPAGYQPVGIGDFNHDGTSDVLWFNATTRTMSIIWKIANGQWAGSVDVGTHPAGYQPAGVGDFNHDGTSDILWYNPTTRDVDIWLISNGQWAGSVDIGTHPAGWSIAGIGDFNRDGTSDVLWYNAATNDIDIWEIRERPLGWQRRSRLASRRMDHRGYRRSQPRWRQRHPLARGHDGPHRGLVADGDVRAPHPLEIGWPSCAKINLILLFNGAI